MHEFDSLGANPNASLTPSVTGDTLFGETFAGGDSGLGTLFSIDTTGTNYTTLLNFTILNSNGGGPTDDLLLLNGVLYGMTEAQGNYYGCAFSIKTDGTGYKDLLNFNDTNGGRPYGNSFILYLGKLYGMTTEGGPYNQGEYSL